MLYGFFFGSDVRVLLRIGSKSIGFIVKLNTPTPPIDLTSTANTGPLIRQ